MDMEKFWAKVRKTESCWLWTGATTKGGYGNVCYMLGGKKRWNSPHRLLWIHLRGAIPEGMQVDHECHDPASCTGGPTCLHRRCVNPSHLRLVTPLMNSSKLRNGRHRQEVTHCWRGHPYDGKNTYRNGGKRFCRKCNAQASREYRERRVTA